MDKDDPDFDDYFDNIDLDLEPLERDTVLFSPCAHDHCTECHGTGRKKDGSMCVHMLSCSCPKCTPIF